MMDGTRREFVKNATASALGTGILTLDTSSATGAEKRSGRLIIDTHQHLWDLAKLELPWLGGAPEVLRKNYRTKEYLEATRGLNVKAVYMEVDVAPEHEVAEANHVIALSASDRDPTIAAVIGGRPASSEFASYLDKFEDSPYVKGVRQVLHNPGTKAGVCLRKEFVRGIRLLGEHGLSFDLCMRPGELSDGRKLTELCPDTRFIVDHCGNADPKAFRADSEGAKPSHEPEPWKRDMQALAERPNVICKISGIVARAPRNWSADDLAPIVNHCLDVFGPDRVVFGGDWPVCLLCASLRQWIDALDAIVSERPADQQGKLWHANAQRWYSLPS